MNREVLGYTVTNTTAVINLTLTSPTMNNPLTPSVSTRDVITGVGPDTGSGRRASKGCHAKEPPIGTYGGPICALVIVTVGIEPRSIPTTANLRPGAVGTVSPNSLLSRLQGTDLQKGRHYGL